MALAPDPVSMGAYLGMWGVLTLFLFLNTFRLNRAHQLVFGTLVVLFLLLAYGNATSNAVVLQFAGYEGVVCGFLAIYTAIAQVTNEVHGSTVLPLGNIKSI